MTKSRSEGNECSGLECLECSVHESSRRSETARCAFESMLEHGPRQIGSGACIAVASSEVTVCLPIGNGSHSQEISFCVAVGLEPGLCPCST